MPLPLIDLSERGTRSLVLFSAIAFSRLNVVKDKFNKNAESQWALLLMPLKVVNINFFMNSKIDIKLRLTKRKNFMGEWTRSAFKGINKVNY